MEHSDTRVASDIDDERLEGPPSLNASLTDFSSSMRGQLPIFGMRSSRSSAFRSEEPESDPEPDSPSPWSPPAWSKTGSGWYRQQPALPSPSKSRGASPMYESAAEGDLTIPAQIPLPPSRHQSTRSSPERAMTDIEEEDTMNNAAEQTAVDPAADTRDNYIKWTMRAEMQHRTEFIDAAFIWFREKVDAVFRSRTSLGLTVIGILTGWLILGIFNQTPIQGPLPDLITVASLAEAYEPLMYTSGNGHQQISPLQDTSVAIWDLAVVLSENNMTSSRLIVQQLDDLRASVNALSDNLQKFFSNVDGDVDHILQVMTWTKGELTAVMTKEPGIIDKFHHVFSRARILESSPGSPTRFGLMVMELIGETALQAQRATVMRTFDRSLNVLEESINAELMYCTSILSLFQDMDHQFQNLQRSVVREQDTQEKEYGKLLASLWTRAIGGNAARIDKFEKNLKLLNQVHSRTVINKSMITDYDWKLRRLKLDLEKLRQQLFKPLVRSSNSTTTSIEVQIEGITAIHQHLHGIRRAQKQKQRENLYAAGRNHPRIQTEEHAEIGGR